MLIAGDFNMFQSPQDAVMPSPFLPPPSVEDASEWQPVNEETPPPENETFLAMYETDGVLYVCMAWTHDYDNQEYRAYLGVEQVRVNPEYWMRLPVVPREYWT